ncbi:hypothetical protein BaRGS_00015735 [Batillaria attramentaria]|uniref:Uncharacterized protein n=1 Tax=Batillaria attramentaria TaxID=370345 RepID=A0ABD0L0U3_9CAEN
MKSPCSAIIQSQEQVNFRQTSLSSCHITTPIFIPATIPLSSPLLSRSTGLIRRAFNLGPQQKNLKISTLFALFISRQMIGFQTCPEWLPVA